MGMCQPKVFLLPRVIVKIMLVLWKIILLIVVISFAVIGLLVFTILWAYSPFLKKRITTRLYENYPMIYFTYFAKPPPPVIIIFTKGYFQPGYSEIKFIWSLLFKDDFILDEDLNTLIRKYRIVNLLQVIVAFSIFLVLFLVLMAVIFIIQR